MSRPVPPQDTDGRERRGRKQESIETVPFAYMLECADGSLYVGSTRNLEKRMWEHEIGLGAAYTAKRRPLRLVWVEEHEHLGAAFAREKQVQNWSRAKRLALIEQRWDDLHELARKRGRRQR